MTPEQFAYWLQGFAEVSGDTPTPEQWEQIKQHLHLVFHKVTPTYSPNMGPVFTPGTPGWPDFNPIPGVAYC